MKRIYSVTKAYHSTRQKGLKKFESRTTTATIDTGEGAHVHGWGLYLQVDEMANRESYLEPFAGAYGWGSDFEVHAWGGDFIAYYSADTCVIDDYNSFNVFDFGDAKLSDGQELYLMLRLNGYENREISYFLNRIVEKDMNNEYEDDEYPEILNHWTYDDLTETINLANDGTYDYSETPINKEPEPLPDGTHYEGASQYTVEIPDDMVFIDEDKPVPEWLFNKWAEMKLGRVPTDEQKDAYRELEYSGYELYNTLKKYFKSDEKASLWLSEHGIDGMTYEGGRDNGCFVIFNCDKLKIIAEY